MKSEFPGTEAPKTVGSGIGLFKVGQLWSVDSQSKSAPLPAGSSQTVFRIEQVIPARQTVIGRNVLTSGLTPDRFPVQIEISSAGELLVADVSPTAFGARNIRVCFFAGRADQDGTYQGKSAYYDLSQTAVLPDGFQTKYVADHPQASKQEADYAFIEAASGGDTGACTLNLRSAPVSRP